MYVLSYIHTLPPIIPAFIFLFGVVHLAVTSLQLSGVVHGASGASLSGHVVARLARAMALPQCLQLYCGLIGGDDLDGAGYLAGA